jgi:hypothetical protein
VVSRAKGPYKSEGRVRGRKGKPFRKSERRRPVRRGGRHLRSYADVQAKLILKATA